MSSPFNVFRDSNLWVDCEACRFQVNMSRAGACRRCRRVLCNHHLHGSFLRRLLVDVGVAEPICGDCRNTGSGKGETGN